jgi:hypothetical protein
LEQTIALQASLGLGSVHVVDVGPTAFRLAHTDDERARGENTETCPVHQWLQGLDGPPADVGTYVIGPHQPDLYSEPYRSDPYDLWPVEGFEQGEAV